MNIIDLTHVIAEDMPVYPGTETPRLEAANTYERDGFKETRLSMYSHTGTHMDAPAHLFANRTTLDAFDASQFVGSAAVIDCRDVGAGGRITMAHVNRNRENADRAEFVLFCTGWDKYWGKAEYFGEYPYIDGEVAQYLVDGKKKGVGLDVIGLDPISDVHLTLHRKLLQENEIVIIENLTGLERIGTGLFTLCALPLKYENADGAPIRAVALVDAL